MANPQIENGYTKIANEIMDRLVATRIPGEARQVFDCILRKTYGYNKTIDAIPLIQFCNMTGLSKTTVCKAIQKLLSMNLIITQKGNEVLPKKVIEITEYCINKDFDTWIPLPKKVMLPKKETVVTQKGNLPLPNWGHSKDNKTKDNAKDKRVPPTPYQKVLDLYHEICKDFPVVKEFTNVHKNRIKNHSKNGERDLGWWKDFWLRCSASDFLSGKIPGRNGNPPFKASIDWILKPENFSKILNGTYDNRQSSDSYQRAARGQPGDFLKKIHQEFEEIREEKEANEKGRLGSILRVDEDGCGNNEPETTERGSHRLLVCPPGEI